MAASLKLLAGLISNLSCGIHVKFPNSTHRLDIALPIMQDYFTNKVCSVGKSCSPRDMSHREILYGPVHGALRCDIFPIFMAISLH